jgi:hypothetical protein
MDSRTANAFTALVRRELVERNRTPAGARRTHFRTSRLGLSPVATRHELIPSADRGNARAPGITRANCRAQSERDRLSRAPMV